MKSVFVLVTVIIMVGCTRTRTQESTREYADDTFITSQAKTLLPQNQLLVRLTSI